MESGGSDEKKKISSGFSLADEKIKLIDLLSEDDDFLVASPFCDSLEEGSFSEVELIPEKEQNLLPSNVVQQSRPSFLRRSLAWDTAFFNSAGVLDPDELSFINKGFRKTESHLLTATLDVRNRKPESGSTQNGDDFFVDWFEIEPSIYKAKSSKVLKEANKNPESDLNQDGPQNVQSFKKVDRLSSNKMKSIQTSSGKRIDVQSEGKTKKESTARRRQGKISSPKLPKAMGGATCISPKSNDKYISGKSNLKIDNKSARTGSGNSLVMQKKSVSLTSPRLSSIVSSTAATASSLSKGKTEWNKSQHSASLPASKNQSSCSSPASPSVSLSSAVVNKKTSIKSNDAKKISDLRSNFQSPKQFSSETTPGTRYIDSVSAKSIRPSGLRPPSPHIRFFDENSSPLYHGATRSRKMPHKVLPKGTAVGISTEFDDLIPQLLPDSACKKLTSPCSELAKNIKRPKTELADTSVATDKEDATGIIHNEAPDQENGSKKLSFSVDQLDNLSRYFEAIDLNQEKATQHQKKQTDWNSKRNKIKFGNHGVPVYSLLKHESQLLDSSTGSLRHCRLSPPSVSIAASIPSMRTPLADRTSACNFNGAFGLRVEPKKEKKRS